MVHPPESLAVTCANWRHLVPPPENLSARTDRVRTAKKQACKKWTLTLSQTKFPVTAEKIPVPRDIFPVNFRRELSKKWLQHSGFLL
jgi:hypothetical protein